MTEKLLAEIESGQIAKDQFVIVKPMLEAQMSQLHQAWEMTTQVQTEDREILYRQLQAIKGLIRSFENEIDTGKLASKQLESENDKHRR